MIKLLNDLPRSWRGYVFVPLVKHVSKESRFQAQTAELYYNAVLFIAAVCIVMSRHQRSREHSVVPDLSEHQSICLSVCVSVCLSHASVEQKRAF